MGRGAERGQTAPCLPILLLFLPSHCFAKGTESRLKLNFKDSLVRLLLNHFHVILIPLKRSTSQHQHQMPPISTTDPDSLLQKDVVEMKTNQREVMEILRPCRCLNTLRYDNNQTRTWENPGAKNKQSNPDLERCLTRPTPHLDHKTRQRLQRNIFYFKQKKTRKTETVDVD